MAKDKPVPEVDATTWADPGFFAQQAKTKNVFRVIKQLFVPPQGHRTIPTASGIVLIILALGIGSAAYNTANNILFMTLSLLLSCLILSGILAWVNYKSICWRMLVEPHFRAGEITPIRLEVANRKRFLPTYALKFNFLAEEKEKKETLFLPDRLDAGETVSLEWLYEPPQRGEETVTLKSVETQFPFGFLRKTVAGLLSEKRLVWPARITYEFNASNYQRGYDSGLSRKQTGRGMEILKVRDYQAGDSQRSVHWKATARLQKLMVRETAAEQKESYIIYFDASSSLWTDSNQFDRACAFAGSLAEDLYMAGRLAGYALNNDPFYAVQRLGDVHGLLDKLSVLEPAKSQPSAESFHGSVITFNPGKRGSVLAYVGGVQTGEA